MAATTISRATWTDGVSGTVLNNARLQADVYDKIDALIAASITFGGTVSSEGFGTHDYTAGGTGGNRFRIRNTTAGTANFAALTLGNDASAVRGDLAAFSSTFTAAGRSQPDGMALLWAGSGGIAISAEHASGKVSFFTGSTTAERARITSGGALFVAPAGVFPSSSSAMVLSHTSPAFDIHDSSAGSDLKNWRWICSAGDMYLQTVNDAFSSAVNIIQMNRGTGTTVDDIRFTPLIYIQDGSAAAPSLAFTSKPDDGFYLVTGANNGPGVSRNGVLHTSFKKTSTSEPQVEIHHGSFGTGARAGCSVRIGRNDSGNGAAAYLDLMDKNSVDRYIWVDASGNVRIGSPPTEDGSNSDTGGTVVGTQTSSRDVKDVIERVDDTGAALRVVLNTPLYRWRYKPGHSIQGEEFMGIITDESPLFGMDRDAAHPGGRSLNVANAVGLLVAAVQAQQQQIDALRKDH